MPLRSLGDGGWLPEALPGSPPGAERIWAWITSLACDPDTAPVHGTSEGFQLGADPAVVRLITGPTPGTVPPVPMARLGGFTPTGVILERFTSRPVWSRPATDGLRFLTGALATAGGDPDDPGSLDRLVGLVGLPVWAAPPADLLARWGDDLRVWDPAPTCDWPCPTAMAATCPEPVIPRWFCPADRILVRWIRGGPAPQVAFDDNGFGLVVRARPGARWVPLRHGPADRWGPRVCAWLIREASRTGRVPRGSPLRPGPPPAGPRLLRILSGTPEAANRWEAVAATAARVDPVCAAWVRSVLRDAFGGDPPDDPPPLVAAPWRIPVADRPPGSHDGIPRWEASATGAVPTWEMPSLARVALARGPGALVATVTRRILVGVPRVAHQRTPVR